MLCEEAVLATSRGEKMELKYNNCMSSYSVHNHEQCTVGKHRNDDNLRLAFVMKSTLKKTQSAHLSSPKQRLNFSQTKKIYFFNVQSRPIVSRWPKEKVRLFVLDK